MKEDFVSYELAAKLKAAGFNWPCTTFYRNLDHELMEGGEMNWNNGVDYSAPTLWQAQKWLREKWGMHVYPTLESVNEAVYDCKVIYLRKGAFRFNKRYPTYEHALSAGIAAALELINY